MQRFNINGIITLSIISLLFSACNSNSESAALQVEDSEYDFALREHMFLFEVLPISAKNENNLRTEEKIALEHALYFDARFWDGRTKDLEEQAGMPILNPAKMAIPSKEFLVERLRGIDLYNKLFAVAYPQEDNPLSYGNIQNAIAIFERELITPSRYDQYLAGNKSALNKQEKQGMMSFVVNGCASCHNGTLLGGNAFQKFGVYDDYWKYTNSKKIDEGLASQTGKREDKYVFKAPSLRNVAQTGPYLHDGSVSDLKEVIKIMGKVQLNKDLSQKEIENIAAFLSATTGTFPEMYKKAPAVLN
jgi:cytochrome c peroxidase